MTGKQQSKRKHPRIPYTGKVDLIFANQVITECAAQNLSLVGIWVMGNHHPAAGSVCDIEFHDAAPAANRPLRLKGEVTRTESNGIALMFTNNNLRNYTELEALIKEKGGDVNCVDF
ncbi:PilZ domain-containing protein [Desulfobacterota bacterium M19]